MSKIMIPLLPWVVSQKPRTMVNGVTILFLIVSHYWAALFEVSC